MPIMEIALTSVVDWLAEKAFNRALDVAWRCLVPQCAEPAKSRIENVAHNIYYCRNCHTEHRQFTNACRTTVLKDGRLAHVAIEYDDEGEYIYDHRGEEDGIAIHGNILFQGLANRQIRSVDTVFDLDKPGTRYCRRDDIWLPSSNFETYTTFEIVADFKDMPRKLLDGRVLAFETVVTTRFGDVLLKDRCLEMAD